MYLHIIIGEKLMTHNFVISAWPVPIYLDCTEIQREGRTRGTCSVYTQCAVVPQSLTVFQLTVDVVSVSLCRTEHPNAYTAAMVQ